MWNNTDTPLAVFFTFRCYGTWLHGDERGSVDRHNNSYGSPRIPSNPNWRKFNETQLSRLEVKLNVAQRRTVEKAIKETCKERNWELLIVNVRTNHVHTVISIGASSSQRALAALKANATRRLRDDKLWSDENTPWAEKGSKRNLWNEKSVGEACAYVQYDQGDKLPDFDWW